MKNYVSISHFRYHFKLRNQFSPRLMASTSGDENRPGSDSDTDVLDQIETEEPALYRVIIHNDDYTPMDFVVYVLKNFFKHDDKSAEKIMLDVHHKGSGTAGVYTFEVAETKSMQVNQFAKSNKYPLKSSIEEDK